MHELPDPEWYLDNVLSLTEPGDPKSLPTGPARRWRQWWHRQERTGDPLVRLAAQHGFVLTTAHLRAAGVTRSAARHAVDTAGWSVPLRGFICPVRLDDGADRHTVARRAHAVAATAAAAPGHAISARSAAILEGLPTLAVPSRPELTVLPAAQSGERTGRRPSRQLFAATLDDRSTTPWFGVARTTVARTLVDLARHDRRDAIMAADAALHERLTTPADVRVELERAAGWPGVRRARAVLGLADPLAESALESLVRLVLHDDGFPPPQLQVGIGAYRVDLCWPEHRLVLEADGLGKYSAAEWRNEKRREQALRALGYRVERITWDDLLRRWPGTSVRLRRELSLPGGNGR